MMQHQQQVRSIIKFNAPAGSTEGRQQHQSSGNSDSSNKPQRFTNSKKNGNSSWKQNNEKSSANQNSHRNVWELSTPNSSGSTPQMAKMGITSPTSSQSSKDSLSTIWFTPPQSHSPASSAGGESGFTLTSTPFKTDQQQQQQVGRMIRAQDLSSGKGANIWSSPPPQLPSNGVSARFLNASSSSAAVVMAPGAGVALQSRNTSTMLDSGAKASNACLQLFSDNFMSYLNMIN